VSRGDLAIASPFSHSREKGRRLCVQSQDLPNFYHEIGTGEPIEGDDVLEFRLLYSGQVLGASRSDTRAAHKHAIRRELHPQLMRLWNTHRGLKEMAHFLQNDWHNKYPDYNEEVWRKGGYTLENPKEWTADEMQELGLRYLAEKWERFGCGFIPLITSDFCLRCAIDILFLRPENTGALIQSGDLDNRVKTIFDALRIPANLDECGGSLPEENPMYCLLEDDKLISEIRVNTDQLLQLPRTPHLSVNDAFLILHVRIEPTSQTAWEHVFR
jgi:hypothetical protein